MTEPRPGDYGPSRGSACVGYRLRSDALVALALALERVFLAAPPVLVGALAAAGGSAGLGVGRVLTGSLQALLLLAALARLLALVLLTAHDGDSLDACGC